MYTPDSDFHCGGFAPGDGTIDFYLRVRTLLSSCSVIVDYGAGRGKWFVDDKCSLRHNLRNLKADVKIVYGVDTDSAIFTNESVDHKLILDQQGRSSLADASVDLIVADYVLEHIKDPPRFAAEIDRILKPSGWLCARTPHAYSIVSVASRLTHMRLHQRILSSLQPDRKAEDVFTAYYKLNTFRAISKHFDNYRNHSFIFKGLPSYYFGNRFIYKVLSKAFDILPSKANGNLFVFLQKPGITIDDLSYCD